jgi:hypothetical protein
MLTRSFISDKKIVKCFATIILFLVFCYNVICQQKNIQINPNDEKIYTSIKRKIDLQQYEAALKETSGLISKFEKAPFSNSISNSNFSKLFYYRALCRNHINTLQTINDIDIAMRFNPDEPLYILYKFQITNSPQYLENFIAKIAGTNKKVTNSIGVQILFLVITAVVGAGSALSVDYITKRIRERKTNIYRGFDPLIEAINDKMNLKNYNTSKGQQYENVDFERFLRKKNLYMKLESFFKEESKSIEDIKDEGKGLLNEIKNYKERL